MKPLAITITFGVIMFFISNSVIIQTDKMLESNYALSYIHD